MLVERHNFAV